MRTATTDQLFVLLMGDEDAGNQLQLQDAVMRAQFNQTGSPARIRSTIPRCRPRGILLL